MKSRKRVLSIILSLAMVISLIPTSVFGAVAESEPPVIKGNKVAGSYECNVETKTLTLNDLVMEWDSINEEVINSESTDDWTIVLNGDNKITAPRALYFIGNLTIKGPGKLTLVNEGDINNTTSIQTKNTLTVDGARLDIVSDADGALSAENDIVIKNKANIKILGKTEYVVYNHGNVTIDDSVLFVESNAIMDNPDNAESALRLSNNLVIKNGADVTVKTGASSAVNACNVDISDSKVNFNVDSPKGNYFNGISASGNIKITNSTFNSKVNATYGTGFYTNGNIDIEKSNVNIDTKYISIYSLGKTPVNISDSEVMINSSKWYDIYANGDINITKSKLDLKAPASFTLYAPNITIDNVKYDKNKIAYKYMTPADYSKVDAAIAEIPADLTIYTDETVAALNTAKNVDRTIGYKEQAKVDAFVKPIKDAIANLKYKDADYTAVNEAIAKAMGLTKEHYINFNAVQEALDAVVEGKNITEQETVTGYAEAINAAIEALVYKDADYTAVDAAKEAAAKLNKDLYKDFSAVDAALNAVIEGKNITEQETVTGYAEAINAAIEALVYKDADYTAVDEAIESIPADLDLRTEATAKAVINAKDKVVRDLDITHQEEVDAMAKAITDAIDALEYKDADYTAVDAAKEAATKLNKDLYKDFSAVDAALNAVIEGKNITEQEAVDKMAADIDAAIKALVYKDADYTAVDKAVADAEALEPDLYVDFSAVDKAVKAVVTGKDITEQEAVDKMAADINAAIKALVRITPPEVDKETGKTDVTAKDDKAVLAPEEITASKEITIDFGNNKKVVYDKKAVDKIKEAVPGATKVEFVLEETVNKEAMTDAQKKAVEANKGTKVFEITLKVTKADGTVIEVHDFEGGKSTISVPMAKPAAGMTFEVYRVENDGTLKLMNSSYANGILTWITDGHSYYMVKEVALAGAAKPDADKTETPKTGDDNSMMPWMMALAAALAGAGFTVARKKEENK